MTKKMDMKAQMHMLEIVFALIIMIEVTLFISLIGQVPSVSYSSPASQLKVLADDTLRGLDERSADEIGVGYSNISLLAYYIIEEGTKEDFAGEINRGLSFPGMLYNVWRYNSSSDEVELWYPSDKARSTFGTVVRAHRIVVVHESFIYDVVLEVWSI